MTETENKNPPQKPTITMEQFAALDIRMCKILKVESILKNPKKEWSNENPVKAYKLLIDTGIDQRECVTNLVEFSPTALLNQVYPFVLNLPEGPIRGVVSKAMIIATENAAKERAILPAPDSFVGSIVI